MRGAADHLHPLPARPGNKNDGCRVEQKNWDIARRTVGYWRYDAAGELDLLNQIWPILSLVINLFTPQQKLISKTRTGAKVTKRYDTAQTPYQRLLAHASIDPHVLDDMDARRLATLLETTNPAAASREIGCLQATLLERVKCKTITRRAKTNHAYISGAKIKLRQASPSLSGHLQMTQRLQKSSHGAVGATRCGCEFRSGHRGGWGRTMWWSSGLTSPPLGAVSPEKSMTWRFWGTRSCCFERELQTP